MSIVYRETSTSSKTRWFTKLTPKRVLLKKIAHDEQEIEKLRNLNEVYEDTNSYLNERLKSIHRDLDSLKKTLASKFKDQGCNLCFFAFLRANHIDAPTNNNGEAHTSKASKQQTSSGVIASEVKQPPSLGYLIQTLTGTTPPKYIHEDIQLANAEAQRLARKYNSSVRILEIIATIKPTTKQVPVTETIQTLEFQVSERMCELQNPNDDLPF